jgi:spermidine/putrescine transport system ATP-binding protein
MYCNVGIFQVESYMTMTAKSDSQSPLSGLPQRTSLGEVICLDRVRKQFSDNIAVNDITALFYKGEYFCILGPSGCGKTTLLRLIAGFEEPDSGEIFLEGKSLNGIHPEHRNVNMMFQDYALFPHMTVYENIAFGLRMKKFATHVIRTRVGESLEMVNLGMYWDRYPRQLSGGERQRVALVRALVNRPAVLLLDEPLGALDQNLRVDMQVELKKIQRETGITFLHVTHDQDEALTMSDRLAIMKDGRFVQVGPPQDLYDEPLDRFAAEFLGTSNIIETPVYGKENPLIVIEDNPVLHVDKKERISPGDGKCAFLIRPEKIRLFEQKPPYDHNVLKGKTVSVTYSGSTVLYLVQTGKLTLRVTALAETRVPLSREGNDVYLYIAPRDIVPLAADRRAEA